MFHESKTVAINCSDYSIEALELIRDKGSLRIKNQSRIVLQTGIIEDGRIIDPDRLREAVRQLLAQAKPNPITTKEVVITLPESKVFVQSIIVGSSVAKKGISAALIGLAAERLPLDPKGMAADFRLVRKGSEGQEYLFAATQRPLVQEYVSLFQSLQLKVTLVTMESLALAAATIDESVDENVLVLDIGARTSIASIFSKGDLVESININIAGNAITAALAEKLKISASEAEQRKIATGLTSANGNGNGSEMLIIQGQVQPLKDELVVFIKFYERKTGTTISRVLLAGGSAALAGLDEYLSANIGLPVSVAHPLPVFALEPDQLHTPTFMVALGLARIALGERKAAIDFLASKSDAYDASSAESPKSPLPGSLQGVQTVRRRPRLLTIVLVVAAVLAANVAAWALWSRYGTPGAPFSDTGTTIVGDVVRDSLDVIIRPFTGTSGNASLTLSFVLTLDLSPDQLSGGALPARRGTIQIDRIVPYDQSTVEYVHSVLRQSALSGSDITEEEVAEALKLYLADRLWDEQYQFYYDESLKEGVVLLASPVGRTLNAAESTGAGDNQAELTQMRLNVDYSVLFVTDVEAFQLLEGAAIDAFTESNPGSVVSKRLFTYDDATADPVQASALYTFKK